MRKQVEAWRCWFDFVTGRCVSQLPLAFALRPRPSRRKSVRNPHCPDSIHSKQDRQPRRDRGRSARLGTNATAQQLFQCQLLSDGAIPVVPPALKEAVTHHALTQKKKDDCQNEYEHELSNSKRRWLSSWRSRIHRIKPPSQSRPRPPLRGLGVRPMHQGPR
jgi:hypothetical protein